MQKTMTALLVSTLISSGNVAAVTVDLMVLHTPGVATLYNGDADTRAQHLVNVANQVYLNSGLDITLRLVHSQQVDYPDLGKDDIALSDLTHGSHQAFNEISGLRSQYGADMVVLLRPEDPAYQGRCGLGWVGGTNTTGRAEGNMSNDKNNMFSHVVVQGCPDTTLVHELGHNMGLSHSWLQDNTGGGTFSYALGHGEPGLFSTIMGNPGLFGVSNSEYVFSSPALQCKGRPCGVPIGQPNEADAVSALKVTVPQIADFYPTKVVEGGAELAALEEDVAKLRQAWATEQATYTQMRALFDSKEQRYKALQSGLAGRQSAADSARQVFEDTRETINKKMMVLARLRQAIHVNYSRRMPEYVALEREMFAVQRTLGDKYREMKWASDLLDADTKELSQLANLLPAEQQSLLAAEAKLAQARSALIQAENRLLLAQAKTEKKTIA